MAFNQGGGNQFLWPLQELSICIQSETAAAASCSELFSIPRNGLERNYEILLLFSFHRREFRGVFSSSEGFGREFREFASVFVPRNEIPSCSLFR